MKKENTPSRAWKELQRGTASNESYDGFAALVGASWALRRAKKSEREMTEAVERIVRIEEEIVATRTGEKSSTSEACFGETCRTSTSTAFSAQRRAAEGDGLFKCVVLYALTLVLQPLLTVVLSRRAAVLKRRGSSILRVVATTGGAMNATVPVLPVGALLVIFANVGGRAQLRTETSPRRRFGYDAFRPNMR